MWKYVSSARLGDDVKQKMYLFKEFKGNIQEVFRTLCTKVAFSENYYALENKTKMTLTKNILTGTAKYS